MAQFANDFGSAADNSGGSLQGISGQQAQYGDLRWKQSMQGQLGQGLR
jgi:hypothetical protein